MMLESLRFQRIWGGMARGEGGDSVEVSRRAPSERRKYIFIRSVLFTNHYLYPWFTPGSIRFWCRDPLVQSSSNFARVAKVGSSASGSFAAKSEWTLAMISFQCCNQDLSQQSPVHLP